MSSIAATPDIIDVDSENIIVFDLTRPTPTPTDTATSTPVPSATSIPSSSPSTQLTNELTTSKQPNTIDQPRHKHDYQFCCICWHTTIWRIDEIVQSEVCGTANCGHQKCDRCAVCTCYTRLGAEVERKRRVSVKLKKARDLENEDEQDKQDEVREGTFYVEQKSQKVVDDDEITCAICSGIDSEEPNQILLCDNCDRGYHQACYDIFIIPEGDWLCRDCQPGGDFLAPEEVGSAVSEEN